MSGPEEFWRAVDRSGGTTACWPWKLSTTKKRRNYGQVNWCGKVRRAHRVAYELTFGAIDDRPLDHTCHDPDTCVDPCSHTACCNPAHLQLVTQAENNARRARSKCGRGHPKTPEHGSPRGTKWRCRTCHEQLRRERRTARRAVA